MTDERPVYLIPRSEYEGNYSVEGEGVPRDGIRLVNGCQVRARIEYEFTGPDGERIYEDQILSENWKEEWAWETSTKCDCCAKRTGVYKMEETTKRYLEDKYPGDKHPQTMDELNKLWYSIVYDE